MSNYNPVPPVHVIVINLLYKARGDIKLSFLTEKYECIKYSTFCGCFNVVIKYESYYLTHYNDLQRALNFKKTSF